MTETLQAMLLALVQGLTEFLPISSSAHLILPAQLLGWPDQGLAFDVAVHVGSLLAVLLYFRRELFGMAVAVARVPQGGEVAPEARLVALIVAATLPATLVGLHSQRSTRTRCWSRAASTTARHSRSARSMRPHVIR